VTNLSVPPIPDNSPTGTSQQAAGDPTSHGGDCSPTAEVVKNISEDQILAQVCGDDLQSLPQSRGSLQTDVATKIKDILKGSMMTAAGVVTRCAHEIGHELLVAKKGLRHGEFGPFLDEIGLILGWSRTVINDCIRAAKYPDFREFHGEKEAMVLLTRHVTPDRARKKALNLSKAGTFVTHGRALKLIGSYAVEQKTTGKAKGSANGDDTGEDQADGEDNAGAENTQADAQHDAHDEAADDGAKGTQADTADDEEKAGNDGTQHDAGDGSSDGADDGGEETQDAADDAGAGEPTEGDSDGEESAEAHPQPAQAGDTEETEEPPTEATSQGAVATRTPRMVIPPDAPPLPVADPKQVFIAVLSEGCDRTDIENLAAKLSSDSLSDAAICLIPVGATQIPAGIAVIQASVYRYQTCLIVTPSDDTDLPAENLGMAKMQRIVLVGALGGRPDLNGVDATLKCGMTPAEKVLHQVFSKRFPLAKIERVA
jgi:hypothetical protein